jgi:hypothetical protein
MKRLLLAGLIIAMLCPAAMADDLQLTSGTMQLGGSATFDIDMMMPDEGDSTTGFALNIMPTAGYFLMDNLELNGMLKFGMGFGDLYEHSSKLIGFAVGAKYYIPMGSMVPYAGAMIGMGFTIPDEGDTAKELDIIVPLGLLMPLNAHLALDLGVQVIYAMSLEDGGISVLHVPIGYLGVQGFF